MLKFDLENLKGEDFGSVELSGVEFIFCQMTAFKVDGSILTGGTLHDCELTEAEMKDSNLDGVSFSACSGESFKIEDSSMNGASLTENELSNLIVSDSNLQGASLVGNKLFQAQFSSNTFAQSKFELNLLNQATLSGSSLTDCTFSENELSSACLKDLTLTDVRFTRNRIVETSFSNVRGSSLMFGKNIFRDNVFLNFSFSRAHILASIEFQYSELTTCVWDFSKVNKPLKFLACEINQSTLSFREGVIGLSKCRSKDSEFLMEDAEIVKGHFELPSFELTQAVFRNTTLVEPNFAQPLNVKRLTFIDCVVYRADFSAFRKDQLDFINTDVSTCTF